MLKSPYRTEATLCFQQLQATDELYRKTIDQILKTAKSDAPFRERLEGVVNTHIDAIEQPSELILRAKKKSWKEQDIYLCCFFDVLDGLFAAEAEAIASSTFGPNEKKHALDRLIRVIKEEVPLGGPRWNQNTQPRIIKRLEETKNKFVPK